MMRFASIFAIFIAMFLAGCAVNPVTGERDLSLVGEAWEIQTGEQYYAPLRQAQGGDYVLDPALVSYVQDIGKRLAAESDRELPYEFAVINSSTPNAWALPGGKISVNRGLLTELNSEAELAAVLAHEVVHAAARHTAQSQSRAVLAQGAVILGGVAVGAATDSDDYATVAMLGGMLGAHLINQRYSRDAEREADYYGMVYMDRAGYDPKAAVTLQETFVRLSEGRASGFMDGMFASHPPSPERVENNRRTLEELGAGGRTGRDRYRQAVAGIMALEDAYKAHDEGRKALADGNSSLALQKAGEAIALEGREAIFHALKGDALATSEQWADAESAYSDALSRDDKWFYQHLRRGMVRERQNKRSGARSDLKASIERLQTAEAHFYLGNVERADGNRQQAIDHYRIAAQSDSEVGRKARQALVDMGVEAEVQDDA